MRMTEHSRETSVRVVVLGGGYAGTLAANRLQARADVEVTLVNPRPQFVERIRLHQLVAGTSAASVDFGAISLGRHAGTVAFSHRDDTARNLYLGGRVGAFLKEEVCKATVSGIQREGRKPGAFSSLKGAGARVG